MVGGSAPSQTVNEPASSSFRLFDSDQGDDNNRRFARDSGCRNNFCAETTLLFGCREPGDYCILKLCRVVPVRKTLDLRTATAPPFSPYLSGCREICCLSC